MYGAKFSPQAQKSTLESVDSALKRGVTIQTSFFTKNEIKRNNKLIVESENLSKTEDSQDAYGADMYHQLAILGFINNK